MVGTGVELNRRLSPRPLQQRHHTPQLLADDDLGAAFLTLQHGGDGRGPEACSVCGLKAIEEHPADAGRRKGRPCGDHIRIDDSPMEVRTGGGSSEEGACPREQSTGAEPGRGMKRMSLSVRPDRIQARAPHCWVGRHQRLDLVAWHGEVGFPAQHHALRCLGRTACFGRQSRQAGSPPALRPGLATLRPTSVGADGQHQGGGQGEGGLALRMHGAGWERAGARSSAEQSNGRAGPLPPDPAPTIKGLPPPLRLGTSPKAQHAVATVARGRRVRRARADALSAGEAPSTRSAARRRRA